MAGWLPRPAYAEVGLEDWLREVCTPLPLPPGPPAGWTCLLTALGADALTATDDHAGDALLDGELARAWLSELGRPCHPREPLPLLLVSPIPADASLTDALTALLASSSYAIRQRAVAWLGRLAGPEAWPNLRDALVDPDNDVRRSAAEAVGRWAQRLADPGLSARAARAVTPGLPEPDPDASVDLARAEALLRIGLEHADEERLEELADGCAGAAVAHALRAVADGADPERLSELLAGDDDGVKRVVARFTRHRPAVAAALAQALAAALEQTHSDEALDALARALAAGGEEAHEPILEALDHESWRVRLCACVAALESADLGFAEEALHERLRDDDGDVRREAALALTVHGRGTVDSQPLLQGGLVRSYGFGLRAARHAGRTPALSLAAAATGHTRDLGALLAAATFEAADESMAANATLLLGAHPSTAMVAPVLEAMVSNRSGSVSILRRRAAAAALLLTGRAPVADRAAHALLLGADDHDLTPVTGPGWEPLAGELAALAMADPDTTLRRAAIQALGALPDPIRQPYQPLLERLARADVDEGVRAQAARHLPTTWAARGAGQAATALLLGRAYTGERPAGLKALCAADASMARWLARLLLDHEHDIELLRAAGDLVGAEAGEEATATATAALGWLAHESWTRREVGCHVLRALPLDTLSDGLREELREALQERAEHDEDSDVQRTARQALLRLSEGR